MEIYSGLLHRHLRRSILVPVLKCEGLDLKQSTFGLTPMCRSCGKSLRSFGKIVDFQLTSNLKANSLPPSIQSSFQKGHSAETLLLRVLADVYDVIDHSQMTHL